MIYPSTSLFYFYYYFYFIFNQNISPFPDLLTQGQENLSLTVPTHFFSGTGSGRDHNTKTMQL